MTTTSGEQTAAIRHVVAGISTAWRGQRIGELYDFFADDVVQISPAHHERIIGRAGVVETYREFAENATGEDYRESDLTIDVFEETAVATFRYRMSWLRGTEPCSESGSDVLVLANRRGKWQVVWRTLCPDSDE
jgi:ketosteroid isomerase-like protein